MNKLKRYLIFLVGLFVNSLGVSLITKASLGTSPISSIPYVLSLKYPPTLGNFTIIFSLLLIALQIIILRKNFNPENILQIPVSVIFGYFIDFTMYLLFWVAPESYLVKVIALLIGCVILGFGVYLEVIADVVMLPGESFVRAVVQTWKTNFGTTKIIFDSSMTVIAGVLSFVFFGKLNGVREGTIIAALLVGFIARLFGKHLSIIKDLLLPEETADKSEAAEGTHIPGIMEDQPKNVIVIGRQYGSGGHILGERLAEKLGYQLYDREIIRMVAGTTGMSSDFIEKKEESMTNSLLYDLVHQMYQYGSEKDAAPKDQIFAAESKAIQELAQKGNCVIVGRCSDYVLRNHKNVLKVFFSSSMNSRIHRIMERINADEKTAEQKIQKVDKQRADNYRYYTGRLWGSSANFDMTFNTDLGEDYIIKCLMEAM